MLEYIKKLITPDMVSFWVPSGQSRAVDLIRGNHGQCYGTHPNVLALPNLINPSLGWHFDGVNDYINCGNDGSLNFGTGNFAFGAWVKYPVTIPNVWTMMIASKNVDATNRWWFSLRGNSDVGNEGKLYFSVREGASINILHSTFAYNDNVWHFVVAVRDSGSTIKIYVDSGTPDSTVDNGCDVSTTQNLFISDDRANDGWKDSIALPFIANSAWSVAQISNFYLATKGLFSPRG